VSTSEASTCYETPQAENAKGLNWTGRAKMLQFANAERDTSVTAAGPIHIDDYSFLHYVMGQIPVIEFVVRPNDTGFAKRFHIMWCTTAENNPLQSCDRSMVFLRNQFGYMGQTSSPGPCRNHPDGYATSMMRAVARAVDDFLNLENNPINKYWVEKLRFADTDLSKFANVAMRSRQYCLSFTQLPQNGPQNQWNVYDQACAIHHWLRQMALHHAFYKWCSSQPLHRSNGSVGLPHGGPPPLKCPALDSVNAESPQQFDQGLTKELWLQRAIMTKHRGLEEVQTNKLRESLKKQMKSRAITEPSKAVI